LLEKFDPGALLEAHGQQELRVFLERAYVETPTTCDAFVTQGVISQQSQRPTVATFEVTSERCETIA
jgi:hypothetical protein